MAAELKPGHNDLNTRFPDIGREAYGWDPSEVIPGSNKKKEWKYPKGHIYEMSPNKRTNRGDGCTICSNRQLAVGINDLNTTHPEVAKSADGWDPTTVVGGCNEKRSWKCEYGHNWETQVNTRTQGKGCPYCAGRYIWIGFNDLKSQKPEVAKEAHGWDPETIHLGSNKRLEWKCSLGHIFKAVVSDRAGDDPKRQTACPVCTNRQVLSGFNDLKTHFPELASEADGWDSTKVIQGAAARKSWICEKGHKWKTTVALRCNVGTGCPECADYGFNKGKPSWFYLMERPGEQQFGITNDIKERMTHHRHDGWTEMEIVGPYPGEKVLDLETCLRRWLARNIETIAGTKENWSTVKLEVCSLAELKRVSGVETEWF